MGSQRRLLAELEERGITGEVADQALAAIEVLNSAGDDFSNALYAFLEEGKPEQADKELNETLARIILAVSTVSEVIRPIT